MNRQISRLGIRVRGLRVFSFCQLLSTSNIVHRITSHLDFETQTPPLFTPDWTTATHYTYIFQILVLIDYLWIRNSLAHFVEPLNSKPTSQVAITLA